MHSNQDFLEIIFAHEGKHVGLVEDQSIKIGGVGFRVILLSRLLAASHFLKIILI